MFTIANVPLPLPRGQNAGRIDICPTCYANVRNFGALYFVDVTCTGEEDTHLKALITPQGVILVKLVEKQFTAISSERNLEPLKAHKIIQNCQDNIHGAQTVTALPPAVHQAYLRLVGTANVDQAQAYLFTEKSLRGRS